MYQCHDCDQTFDGQPVADAYVFQGNQYGLCEDCHKTAQDGLIRTVARLDKTGSYAWPGGYPLAFYPPDAGIALCFDCARTGLENGDGPIHAEVEDSDQQYYGGVMCDECSKYIVEPTCPECGDELEDKPRLYADNVDASQLCLRCAAKLVHHAIASAYDDKRASADTCCGDKFYYLNVATHAQAMRLPGIGIRITQPNWYAPAGTVYRYR